MTVAVIAQGRANGWQAWITYHNYYKAPDLLGPVVARALGIPYLQVESTRARKRLEGPWARFAQAAEAATDAAHVVFHFSERDADRPASGCAGWAASLIALQALSDGCNTRPPNRTPYGHRMILSIGMMRQGDKLASYQLIAETLVVAA